MRIELLDRQNEADLHALAALVPPEEARRLAITLPRPDMEFYPFLIKDGAGRIVGSITIYDVDRENGTAAFGLVTNGAPPGAGARAAKRVIALIFRNLPLHRIEARVRASNEEVARLAKRFGFQLEGILRQAAGEEDVLVFGLLRDEFRAKWEGER